MKTELNDFSTPASYAASSTPIVDGNSNVHGEYGYAATTVDATDYASAEPYCSFAVGSNMGNATGNNRKLETSASGTVLTMQDIGEYQVKASCTDCTYGEWTVEVKQRIWKKITVTWTAATSDQAPEWVCYVRANDLNDKTSELRVTGTNSAGSNQVTSHVSCLSNIVGSTGDAHEVEINDGGNEASPDSGSWGGEEWSADNDRVVTVEAFWDTNREYNFRCDQSTSDPKDDVEVYLSWRLSVEDTTSPAVDFDPDLASKVAAKLEYGTVIMLWFIEVTYNCPLNADHCPCTKFQETSAAQPNTP